MIKGILHLHITSVTLFLSFYTLKTVLLLLNKNELLDKVRAKSKIADMVLGSLMVITGFYLLTVIPKIEFYFYVKIVVAFASIPIGIVAFKKRNKVLAVALLIAFIYVYGVAETGSLTMKREKINFDEMAVTNPDTHVKTNVTVDSIMAANTTVNLQNGRHIYNIVCIACHGVDGKLGTSGAKDLSISTLSHAEKIGIITNGKGLMAPYKGQLSEQEIEAVGSYVDSLKK